MGIGQTETFRGLSVAPITDNFSRTIQGAKDESASRRRKKQRPAISPVSGRSARASSGNQRRLRWQRRMSAAPTNAIAPTAIVAGSGVEAVTPAR